MNERIKELAKQADKEVIRYANENNINCIDAFNILFAELVVRECAKTIEDVHSKQLGDYLKEVFGVIE